MDCQGVQEEILESFEATAGGIRPEIDVHLAGCPACAEFATQHRTVDARLTAMLVPPELSSGFRSLLRERIRWSTIRPWSDALPDIVHFASCGVATLACALLLPSDAVAIVVGGITAALVAYVPLTVIRSSLEYAE